MTGMRKLKQYGTTVVLAHFAINVIHGMAHHHLAVTLTLAQGLFVTSVIVVAPIISMILLWTRLKRAGAALLLISMAGSLVFGVVNHFLIVASDHILHLPKGEWRLTFQITAFLLVAVEALGCWVGVLALRAIEIDE
jgi:hypothetical protein